MVGSKYNAKLGQATMDIQRKLDISTEAAKSALPVGVTGATMFGVPLDTWVLFLTLLYLLLQIVVILPKVWYTVRNRRNNKQPVD